MTIRKGLLAGLLACALSAQATTLELSADGSWNGFDVSDVIGPGDGLGWIDLDGEALDFSFTIGSGQVGRLTVVDTGFSGDVFSVSANGRLRGLTSAAVNSYPADTVVDPDLALADAAYSRGVFRFGEGRYTVSGRLFNSALDDLGAPINATSGALKLTVSPVPESSSVALLLAGLGLLAFVRRRAQ